MATKRIIQLPTLNQNNQITWSSGKTFVTTTNTPWAIATSSSWWPTTDGGSYVDYNATTDQSGNVIGGSSGRITYDSWGKQITNTVKPVPTMWTNKSVAVMNANKNGTTSSLPQATPAGLPWVTKYAWIDKNYWNNQAGIDLVNKQSELDTLSAAEKAQRLAGAYNPTPTVATAQNPVIKKTIDKPQEQTVTPAALQGADINTLNSTLDELNYKVNVEGKQLSKDEYLAYASAKRQLQEMMKPQALTGWLDSLITNKENEIKQATDESKINNDQELADFTRSQEVYKQAEIDAINQADEEQKKTLWFILWWQGAGQGTFAVEQIGKITQNTLAKKQALNEAVQAKIDLYWSQLRKDSQQTIQAMKDRLDSYYMKAAEFDVDNIKQMNEYNQKEWASKIEQIDKMMALAQSQAMAMQPLTEQEKAQAQAFAGNLYDNEWNFQNNVFEMLYKVNPKLANAAVLQGTAIQKERISNDMAMRWLDADIKRAQLNKLLNPAKEYEFVKDADWNTVAIDKENPSIQIKIWGGMEWLWDMRYLANQFPWQARAKNNNPAGITWNANFDNPKPWTTAYALQQAGVRFEKGTPRPWNEWGNYVTFPTMEDWLAAQRIMMTQTYGNTTVWNMLAKRVWTGEWPRYAQQVAGMAGVDVNARVNQLSDQQLQTLQMAKIQKESPWLAKILQQQTQQKSQEPSQSNFPQYTSYIENGKLPAWMKDWTTKAENFKQQALEWYIQGKEQEFNWAWLTISNPTAFASAVTDAAKIKEVNKAVLTLPKFKDTMDQLISLEKTYWTENRPTQAKQTMNMLVKDAQLQAKEIYNLWVLNWPDLSLMESIIPNPTSWSALWPQILWWVSYNEMLKSAKDKVLWNAYAQARTIWLSPIWTQTQANSDSLWLWI